MWKINRIGTAGLLALILMIVMPTLASAQAVKVVLDPGHGGRDPGAVGINGLYEKHVNLDVALQVREELTALGYDVSMTRDQDVYLSLEERVAYTEWVKPDFFVSVHANAHPNSSIRGSLVLYYDSNYPQSNYPASDAMTQLSPESKKLAQLLQNGMVAEAGTEDRGLLTSAAYVIRMGSVPSALVETAFLSNSEDAALLANADFRRKLAKGIVNGIVAYMPNRITVGAFPDVSATHWANETILRLKEMGIVEGNNGLFYPEQSLTRAEFVTMLERLFPFPELAVPEATDPVTVTEATYTEPPVSVEPPLAEEAEPVEQEPAGQEPVEEEAVLPPDLATDHWAYAAIRAALQKGVLSGYPDGTVRPDQTVSREEAAVLIDRIIWPDGDKAAAEQLFDDVDVTLWSAASINRLKQRGIIEGVTATTFLPNRSISRAEMTVLLGRLIQ